MVALDIRRMVHDYKTVMRCKTKEESDSLFEYLEYCNNKIDGIEIETVGLISDRVWNAYKGETCYVFYTHKQLKKSVMMYSSTGFYLRHGCKVFNFNEFVKQDFDMPESNYDIEMLF